MSLRKIVWHYRQGGMDQVRKYRLRERIEQSVVRVDLDGQRLEPWHLPEASPRRELRVATVVADHVFLGLSYEWDQVKLTLKRWRTDLGNVDIVCIQRGVIDEWLSLAGITAKDLVSACQDAGRPLVVLDFTAAPKGMEIGPWQGSGVHVVQWLPAVQPLLHNPVGHVPDGGRSLLSQIAKRSDGSIGSMSWDACDRATYALSSLTYPELLTFQRGYRAYLYRGGGDADIQGSLEAACAGAAVLSSDPSDLREFLGDAILPAGKDPLRTVADIGNDELGAYSYRARMAVYHRHTYSHRVDDLLGKLGMAEYICGQPAATVMIASKRPHQIRHVLSYLSVQRGVKIQVLFMTQGFVPHSEELKGAGDSLDVTWMTASEDVPLGDMYNRMLGQARHKFVAKIDDDDDYGPYYLLEQLTALDYSGADLVGKGAVVVSLDGADGPVHVQKNREWENRPVQLVAGPTMTMLTSVGRSIGFQSRTTGEDTSFIEAVHARRGTVFSTSKFGFIQNRRGSDHTWLGNEDELRSTGEPLTIPIGWANQ